MRNESRTIAKMREAGATEAETAAYSTSEAGIAKVYELLPNSRRVSSQPASRRETAERQQSTTAPGTTPCSHPPAPTQEPATMTDSTRPTTAEPTTDADTGAHWQTNPAVRSPVSPPGSTT